MGIPDRRKWDESVGQLQLTGLTVVLQGTREEKEKQGNTPQQPTVQQTTQEKETVSCHDKHREVSYLQHSLLLGYITRLTIMHELNIIHKQLSPFDIPRDYIHLTF